MCARPIQYDWHLRRLLSGMSTIPIRRIPHREVHGGVIASASVTAVSRHALSSCRIVMRIDRTQFRGAVS